MAFFFHVTLLTGKPITVQLRVTDFPSLAMILFGVITTLNGPEMILDKIEPLNRFKYNSKTCQLEY